MATVRHHLYVNAAPDEVWKVVADAYSADVLPDELGPTFVAVMGEGIKGLKEYVETR